MAKAVKIMDKTKAVAPHVDQLDVEVGTYLALKAKSEEIAEKMKSLKEKIQSRVEFEKPPFVDGELVLSTGLLKEVKSTPKIVWAKNGKSLTPKEREVVSVDIEDQYVDVDLNTKLIVQNFDQDEKLRQLLGKFNIRTEQDTRIDIKPLK